MTPAVKIHLEEVVLHFAAPSERERAAEALVLELTRLLTERGVPDPLLKGATAPRLDGGSFALSAGLSAEEYGARVARAVYRSLGGRADE
jgi:hypothetical protein